MDPDTLTRLLRGHHLNMDERRRLGLWPHPPISFSDVVRHLAGILESERWFPQEWRAPTPGEMIREGGVIERVSPTKYVYRAQRALSDAPEVLAETWERVFSSAEAAARHYLRWNLQLPGSLDGWAVVDN